jgi:hypothetical protein
LAKGSESRSKEDLSRTSRHGIAGSGRSTISTCHGRDSPRALLHAGG